MLICGQECDVDHQVTEQADKFVLNAECISAQPYVFGKLQEFLNTAPLSGCAGYAELLLDEIIGKSEPASLFSPQHDARRTFSYFKDFEIIGE